MSESYSIIFVPLSTDGSALRPPAAILAAVISTSGALVAPVMPSASSNAPTATSAPYDLISLPMTLIWSDSSDLVIEPKWERQASENMALTLLLPKARAFAASRSMSASGSSSQVKESPVRRL